MSNEIENNNTVIPTENKEAVTEEARSSLLDGKGTVEGVKEVKIDSTWIDGLDEDLKASPYITQFKDKGINELIKSAVNAQSLIGKKVDDFSKEDVEGFYKKIGKPESYTLPEDLSDDRKSELSKLYSEANLSQEQANLLADNIVMETRTSVSEKEASYKVQMANVEAELKESYGGAYEKRMEMASNAILELGGQELLETINDAGLGLNAKFISAMSEIGKGMIEDTIVSADKETRFGITPAEAKAEIGYILADPEKMAAWKNPIHPNHKSVKSQVKRYLEAQGK